MRRPRFRHGMIAAILAVFALLAAAAPQAAGLPSGGGHAVIALPGQGEADRLLPAVSILAGAFDEDAEDGGTVPLAASGERAPSPPVFAAPEPVRLRLDGFFPQFATGPPRA